MRIKLMLSILLLSFCTPKLQAQGSTVFTDEMMEKLFVKFKQIQDIRAAETKEAAAFEAALDKALKAKLAKILAMPKEDEAMRAAYQPGYKHKAGEMNLYPVFEEIPGPIPSLPEAKQVNFQQRYHSFIEKVEVMQKQLSDMEADHLGNQQTSKAQMMQQSKANANKNVVVQQMGGADAVMNMSEAERKAAAKKAVADIKNNPGAVSGVQDAGMNEMMKKIMNDPVYKAKYNKMSDAEKQEELRKYMTNKTVPRNDEQFEQSMRDRQQANALADLQQLQGRCLTNMQESCKPVSNATKLADDFFGQLYRDIDRWYSKAAEQLPVVVMGETRERQGLGALNKSVAMMRYLVQKKEAATRTILWNSLKLRIKLSFGPFNDYIGQFGWGKEKNKSLVDGSYLEPYVAKAVYSLYDQMIQLTKGAEGLTSTHKGQQEQYEMILGLK